MDKRQIHLTIEENNNAIDIINNLSCILQVVGENRNIPDFLIKSKELEGIAKEST
ncbi:MAG: hypothetical protein J7L15_08410 [Clostridiales bacterium]|nr:hypothetical protein [Clostridiales bacterium]